MFGHKRNKIIYCSLQRSGTKSFGDFLKKNGYKVFSWLDSKAINISHKAAFGDYREICKIVKRYEAFEDAPFYRIELIKYIYQQFPSSKFVYFERPVEDWYKSMLSHSNGKTFGDFGRHCEFYNRLDEYLKCHDKTEYLYIEPAKQKYIDAFYKHQNEIKYLFQNFDQDRVFYGHLYDKNKYYLLASKLKLSLNDLHDVHTHITEK